MKDKANDGAMAELYRDDPAFGGGQTVAE